MPFFISRSSFLRNVANPNVIFFSSFFFSPRARKSSESASCKCHSGESRNKRMQTRLNRINSLKIDSLQEFKDIDKEVLRSE